MSQNRLGWRSHDTKLFLGTVGSFPHLAANISLLHPPLEKPKPTSAMTTSTKFPPCMEPDIANRTSKKPFPAPGHPQPCLSLSQTLHLQRAAAITKQVWVTWGQHCYSLTRFLCFQDLGVLCLHHLLHLHPMFDGRVVPDSGWYKQADLGLLK